MIRVSAEMILYVTIATFSRQSEEVLIRATDQALACLGYLSLRFWTTFSIVDVCLIVLYQTFAHLALLHANVKNRVYPSARFQLTG